VPEATSAAQWAKAPAVILKRAPQALRSRRALPSNWSPRSLSRALWGGGRRTPPSRDRAAPDRRRAAAPPERRDETDQARAGLRRVAALARKDPPGMYHLPRDHTSTQWAASALPSALAAASVSQGDRPLTAAATSTRSTRARRAPAASVDRRAPTSMPRRPLPVSRVGGGAPEVTVGTASASASASSGSGEDEGEGEEDLPHIGGDLSAAPASSLASSSRAVFTSRARVVSRGSPRHSSSAGGSAAR